MSNSVEAKKYKKLITITSVIIPVAVVALFGLNLKRMGIDVKPMTLLLPIYAKINGLTAVLLIGAVMAIKNGNRKLHEKLNTFAIVCSLACLLMYIAYHMTSDSTKFGGEGLISYLYYFILISHILLSIAVIQLVLTTYMWAKLEEFDKHKKIAKITFPIWLYVAVTGVVVYLMISHYYA